MMQVAGGGEPLRRAGGPARRVAAPLLGVALLASVGACTGGSGEPAAASRTAPAGVTTGAAPTAPPSPLPTWATGEESSSAAPGTTSSGHASSVPTVSAEVVVTFSQWNAGRGVVEAGGYVGGTNESGGRCTLTLTHAGSRVSGGADAHADATTTWCSNIQVAVPQGEDGDWQAVLAYESPSVHATSAPFTVSVR
jgi:hypothetical protein